MHEARDQSASPSFQRKLPLGKFSWAARPAYPGRRGLVFGGISNNSAICQYSSREKMQIDPPFRQTDKNTIHCSCTRLMPRVVSGQRLIARILEPCKVWVVSWAWADKLPSSLSTFFFFFSRATRQREMRFSKGRRYPGRVSFS